MPVVHRILRAIYQHATGRTLDEKFNNIFLKLDRLEKALGTSSEQALGASSLVFVMEQALKALRTPQPYHEDALAVVSVLPPERTGVAHFTLEAFSSAGYPVDFYCPHLALADYLTLSGRMASSGDRHRVLPLDLLPYGLSTTYYSACVFVLGNSEHHLPAYRALKQWGGMGTPSIVHLHDPCLWNLVSSARDRDRIADMLRRSYPGLVPPRGIVTAQEAVGLGALGSRVLLDSIDLHGVIVNSPAARQLLAAEVPNIPIRTAFHPVFEVAGRGKTLPRRTPGALRVGCFGIPHQEKCTETVLAAFAELRRRHPNAELVLAGYHAPAYARASSLGVDQGVLASEPDSTGELIELMASCDVAVQLRRRDLGESSGILAQLMSVGTPAIATDIGSFRDYRGAARLMPPGSTPAQIAAAITEEAGNRHTRAADVARLVEERSPARFCQVFRNAVKALHHAAPTKARSVSAQ